MYIYHFNQERNALFMSIIRDKSLAPAGMDKINWVKDYMPILNEIEKEFIETKPFAGKKVAISVHMEAKTAYLGLVFKAGGAEVIATGCNPLSTKDEIAAALDSCGIETYGLHGATNEEYHMCIERTLASCPDIIIDDGGDFVQMLHSDHPEYAKNLIGGCEETTTGIHRLKARAAEGSLRFPMMAVNDAKSKMLFDNRYGTGQSVWDGIMYTTNNVIAGRTVVVAGYGWCGKGVAMRAKGLGANVIVTEVDPHCALEATMDGFRVMTMDEAAPLGHFFVTVTGCKDVITRRHFEKMQNNAILANAGHFDVEINKVDLAAMSDKVVTRKPYIEGYYLKDGRVINLMAEGRLVNISAGNGHPADIMDMSFGIQALSAQYILNNGANMKPDLYTVPVEIDKRIARIKLKASGINLDQLTPEQEAYVNGYEGA